MPNWCYTQVCFKGKPENIAKLYNNVERTSKWNSTYGRYFCNVRYLLSLTGFDTVSYYERFHNKHIPGLYDCNFRGNVYDGYTFDTNDGLIEYYPTFEMAWYTDYQLLQLISLIYGVEFSAYSEECGMGIYDKCKNGSVDHYDYDFRFSLDCEQVEEVIEEFPNFEYDYSIPVKIGVDDIDRIKKDLHEYGIDYSIESIENVEVPTPFGVYYHFMDGVIYDTDMNIKFRYPGFNPFNPPLFNGVYYE